MTSKARGLADLGNAFNDGALSNRNLIINGAMQVAQRGTSFASATSNAYHLDRWVTEHSVPINIDQVAGYPDGGFAYSISATSQSTVSLTSGQLLIPFEQRLERTVIDAIGFGTAGAKPLTLSFWIKSNRTGTYTVDLKINGQVGANDAISKQYTINSADTWEYKTLVFPANTTTYSGISFNGSALTLFWWMAAGANFTSGTIPSDWQAQTSANRAVGCSGSVTTGDYWQITGIQLEVGDTATPFEHRSYGAELALCQRYYQKQPIPQYVYPTDTGQITWVSVLSTPLRATPSVTPEAAFYAHRKDASGIVTLWDGVGTYSVSVYDYEDGEILIRNNFDGGVSAGMYTINASATSGNTNSNLAKLFFDAEL
jgi:hypothetical protein